MPEIGLQRPRTVPLVGQRVTAGVAQHMRVHLLSPTPAAAAARCISRAKPSPVNGAPRSLTNTNDDLGSCSFWRRRNARISLPVSGCVLGVPCLRL
jgi:hypothetical protein